MKILYLASSTIPSTTANSNHVMKMCEGFGGIEGSEVYMLCFAKAPSLESDYRFYNVKKNFQLKKIRISQFFPINSLKMLLNILWLLFTLKPDIVIGRFSYGVLLSALLKKRSILELHAPIWEISPTEWVGYKLLRRKSNLSTIFVSDALKKIYHEKLGGQLGRTMVQHDCASLLNCVRDDLDQSDLVDTIGYIGSLHQGKGVEVVIEMAKLLPSYRFLIIGGAEDQVDKFEKISPRNITYLGFIPQNELDKYYDQIDIALLPNQFNVFSYGKPINIGEYTSPLKLFEYWSFCKPIIASKIPVLEEVLIDQKNCILVSPERVDEWVDAVEMLQSKDLRNKIARSGYESVKAFYNWNSRAERILSGGA